MPSFCFLNSVLLNVNQTSVHLPVPPASGPYTFQVITRTAAGLLVFGPTGITIVDKGFTFYRVRWELATTTVYVEGSNTLLRDEWEDVGSLVVPVGAATRLSVTLG